MRQRPVGSLIIAIATSAACVILAGTGCASATPVRSAASSKGTPMCVASGLRIELVRSFAAGGTAGGFLGFTNRSTHLCRLSGWPSVVGIEATGREVDARHVLGTEFGPYNVPRVPVVKLDPGHRADAVFIVATGPENGKSTCGPAFRHIRVTAPGAKSGVVLSGWLPYLDAYLPSCTAISLSEVVPMSALYHG
jgi:hypothetical protein